MEQGRRVVLYLLAFLPFYLFTSCARMGHPDGGWFDETPPHVIGTVPADQSTDVTSRKIIINFDEYIKLDNPTEKVVISPPQLEQPEIKSQGKRIVVNLIDSLMDNTTYTIDFSDAISDFTEGNPLGNYTYSFSTGDHIDTMEVAGTVIEAENLEPIKGILVGLYKVDETETVNDGQGTINERLKPGDSLYVNDTTFRTKPFLRVSHTDDRGRFVIKGVAPGSYRIYALQDADGNYMFTQKGEKLAFLDQIIVPDSKPDVRQDTIWRDSLHILDIRQVPYTHFLPDNIVLRAFTEQQTDRYFIKGDRQEANHFTLYFSYGHEELPQITGLNFNDSAAFIVEPSLKRDTVTYWLRDTALVNQDTLRMDITYWATDSTGQLSLRTDSSLTILSKQPYAKRQKQMAEELEKWKKKQEKLKKQDKPYEEEMPAEPLKPEYVVPSSLAPDKNLLIKMPVPLERIDTAAIHLYSSADSTWYESPFQIRASETELRAYELLGEWRPKIKYSLEIDSAAFTDIYGRVSDAFKQGFSVPSLDTYSTIILNLSGMKGRTAVVSLLSKSEAVVKETTTTDGVAQFDYLKPDKYYIRLLIDDNNNGVWDTGDYDAGLQPEEVYYYPDVLECRENWDLTETWSPKARPLDKQKPGDLVKQKGEKQKKIIKNKNAERARKLGIEYIKPF